MKPSYEAGKAAEAELSAKWELYNQKLAEAELAEAKIAESEKQLAQAKAPAGGYQEFLMNEARYSRLTREFPERADRLFAASEANAKERYDHLMKLVSLYE